MVSRNASGHSCAYGRFLRTVENYGALFLGPRTNVAYGDKLRVGGLDMTHGELPTYGLSDNLMERGRWRLAFTLTLHHPSHRSIHS